MALWREIAACTKPVIAAVNGYALGGGCELMLHSARRVVALESYVGLVEVGVGLIPGAGGLTYIARRAAENIASSTDKDLLKFVTDGFTGNIALKSIEGTAKLYTSFVRDAFRTSTFAKIGYLFASGAWTKLRKRVDPRRYNGGVFLGLDGICVKSHGGTDDLGFAYAIGVAVDLVRYEYKNKLVEGLARLKQVAPAPGPAAVELQDTGGAE